MKSFQWHGLPLVLLMVLPCNAQSTTLADELAEARSLRENGRFAESYARLSSSSLHDHPEALYLAGTMQAGGSGVAKDINAGLVKLKRSLELGHLPAANNIGMVYLKLAAGAKFQDPAACSEAMRYLELSRASSGSPASTSTLGHMHLEGMCVQSDVAKAVSLFEDAARQGKHEAASALERLYSDGRHMPPDADKAAFWRAQGMNNARPLRLNGPVTVIPLPQRTQQP